MTWGFSGSFLLQKIMIERRDRDDHYYKTRMWKSILRKQSSEWSPDCLE